MKNPFKITHFEAIAKPRKWHDFRPHYWSPSAKHEGRNLHPLQRSFERRFGQFFAVVYWGAEDDCQSLSVVSRLPFVNVLGSWSSIHGWGSHGARPREKRYWRHYLRQNGATCHKCAGHCYARSHGKWGPMCTRCGGIGIDPTAYRRKQNTVSINVTGAISYRSEL